MRWTDQQPKIGDTRIRAWFALFPVTINRETRWLERVTVQQEFRGTSMIGEPLQEPSSWVNIRFVDPEQRSSQ